MRVKLTLAYDGTDFHGWQLQKNSNSIQGVMEQALEKICSEPIRIHGSGRTDAGTHALGQVAHFDPPLCRSDIPWQKALNSILPTSIRVINANKTDKDFHARFSCISKTYSYTLWTESDFLYPQRRSFVWQTGSVDLHLMEQAAKHLLGKQDFKSFMNKGTAVSSTYREIFCYSFEPGLYPQELVFKVKADGFLKQMVRNIMGTLADIGRKKYPPACLAWIIKVKNRENAPATAPAKGLCLEKVEYPGHID
ncbi:MAG: tRNA pseudouridine(38-40) synthase TruA [Desulfonatronovibrio sp.]